MAGYLFLSLEDNDDVIDIGNHDFGTVLLHALLSNSVCWGSPIVFLQIIAVSYATLAT